MVRSDDCISITEKTFDLSLEDTEPDDLCIDSDHQQQDKDYMLPDRSIETLIFDDLQDVNQNKTHGGNGKIKNHEINDNLMKSVKLLQKMSGTEINIRNHGSLDSLTKLNLELVENCELKLKFIEKNYKFLEKLYEDLTKSMESQKDKFRIQQEHMEQKLKQWESLGSLIKDKVGEDQTTPQELITLIQNRNGSKDLESVVQRQEKEIKEYKRFIKEMMER